MGICIGLQTLFEASDEAPNEPGLGLIPGRVSRFSPQSKSVPHMGWNFSLPLKADTVDATTFGLDPSSPYYFVHSYRVPLSDAILPYALGLTRYGDETFVSVIKYKNIFATQFHPEKSGPLGLKLLRYWLASSVHHPLSIASAQTELPLDLSARLTALSAFGLTKRIVACLDVRSNDAGDLVVTKGDQYDVRETATTGQVRNLGKPVTLAETYFNQGADEICFLNITSFRACPLQDQPMLEVVRQAARTVFVPLTVGGGIRDTVDPDGTKLSALQVASAYFRAGADKVSIGGDAVELVERTLKGETVEPLTTSIGSIANAYGNQAVVVSIDPKRAYATSLDAIPSNHRNHAVTLAKDDAGPNGELYCWYQCTVKGGRETRDVDVVQLAQGVESLGCGELLINSIDRDGTGRGFDLQLINLVKRNVSIPVVASSGAGRVEHFGEVFRGTESEAGLAAGIFHRKEVPIGAVKEYLLQGGIPIRTVDERIIRDLEVFAS